MILLSGAEKTAQGATYYKNRPHFLFANKVADAINFYIETGEFKIDKNGELEFTNDDNTIEI